MRRGKFLLVSHVVSTKNGLPENRLRVPVTRYRRSIHSDPVPSAAGRESVPVFPGEDHYR